MTLQDVIIEKDEEQRREAADLASRVGRKPLDMTYVTEGVDRAPTTGTEGQGLAREILLATVSTLVTYAAVGLAKVFFGRGVRPGLKPPQR